MRSRLLVLKGNESWEWLDEGYLDFAESWADCLGNDLAELPIEDWLEAFTLVSRLCILSLSFYDLCNNSLMLWWFLFELSYRMVYRARILLSWIEAFCCPFTYRWLEIGASLKSFLWVDRSFLTHFYFYFNLDKFSSGITEHILLFIINLSLKLSLYFVRVKKN